MNSSPEELLDSLPESKRMRLRRLLSGCPTALDQYWICPWIAMTSPDPWQTTTLTQVVTRGEDVLLDCSSQIGKTETVAAAAYLTACLGLFVLVVSPSERQSLNFHRRVLEYHG